MGIPWYVRERRPLLKVLLEFQGNGMEMKFMHMYNCFSCNVEECIHASAMERAIERMNGDVVEEPLLQLQGARTPLGKRRSGQLAGNRWECLGRSTASWWKNGDELIFTIWSSWLDR